MLGKQIDSHVINLMRFPLALFVLIHHSFGKPIEAFYDNFFDLNAYNQVRVLFSHVLVHIDVPIFYFISGYLFYLSLPERWNWNLYQSKLRKKVFTLLIPYLLWNVIALIVSYLIKIFFYHENIRSIMQDLMNKKLDVFWGAEIINRVDYGVLGLNYVECYPINGPLWFMRDLMLMMIISPVIWGLIKKKLGIALIILMMLCFILRLPPLVTGFSWSALAFFSFGAYFSITKSSFTEVFNRYANIVKCFALSLLALDVFYGGGHCGWAVVHPIFIILFMMAFINYASHVVNKNIFRPLIGCQQYCFFLYAGHMGLSLVFIFQYLFRKIIPDTSTCYLLVSRYFLVIFSVALFCIILNKTLKSLFPKVANLFTGNR